MMFALKKSGYLCQTHGFQILRHYRPRKPMWLGKAKSKLLKVPEIPKLPEEEEKELKKLCNNYRTHMKSLKHACKQDFFTETSSVETNSENVSDVYTEELSKLLEENERENERVGKIRMADIQQRALEQKQQLEEQFIEYLETSKKEQEEREKEIEALKVVAETYILPEQLDEAIEKALSNPVDYSSYIMPEENKKRRELTN